MFERYTEKARRIIFFARYEASQFGQPFIETEHLLLGLLREDKALTNRFLRSHASVESIRRQIEKHTEIREKISTSVDLPLSNESKRVLAYAAEEAERLADKHIGTEHLFLGLLREQGCFAQTMLAERGFELERTREEIARTAGDRGMAGARRVAPCDPALYSDLSEKAANGDLGVVVGRDLEVEAVIEILCCKQRSNPMLLGGRGVGKRAIVHALAQRILEGKVPRALADKRVIALSPQGLSAWDLNRERVGDIAKMIGIGEESENLIVFLDGSPTSLDPEKEASGGGQTTSMRQVSQGTGTLCIASTTEEEYKIASARFPWIDKLFRPLFLKPLDDDQPLTALQANKHKLEKFHGVVFAEDALGFAVKSADSYLNDRALPGKALELLDAAAAAVKVRAEEDKAVPDELRRCRARVKSIVSQMDKAIENHEFEKARKYSDEERNERQKLAELEKKFGAESPAAPVVTRADVEQVIAKWNAYPYAD